MKKRIISILMVTILATTGITGCKQKEPDIVVAEVTQTPEPEQPIETEEVKNVLSDELQAKVKEYNASLMDYEKFDGLPPSPYGKPAVDEFEELLTEENGLAQVKDNYLKPISRIEFAKLIVSFIEQKMMLELSVPSVSTFEDTKDEDVLKAYNAGLLGGKTRRTFEPDEPITREEVANIAMKTIQWVCVEYKLDYNTIVEVGVAKLPLADWFDVAQEYDMEVRSAYSNSIMRGTVEGLFIPKGVIKREDALIVVNNVYNKLVEE